MTSSRANRGRAGRLLAATKIEPFRVLPFPYRRHLRRITLAPEHAAGKPQPPNVGGASRTGRRTARNALTAARIVRAGGERLRASKPRGFRFRENRRIHGPAVPGHAGPSRARLSGASHGRLLHVNPCRRLDRPLVTRVETRNSRSGGTGVEPR